MSYLTDTFALPFTPVADPAAVVVFQNARFTVLTSRLIRMEYSAANSFEDRPSQVFWFRKQPVPKFQTRESLEKVEIITEDLHLVYTPDGKGFSEQTLSITFKKSGQVWKFGDGDEGNLLGTTRTLDCVSGLATLEKGLISRDGWSVVDDTRTLVFNAEQMLEPRSACPPSAETQDLYFFGYGHDYKGCLKDYAAIAGQAPLLPRWALGNWWSRYWAYTQAELSGLMNDFEAHGVPLSVCIIDMDWHQEGWTGYTWNKELYPEPEKFIQFLHGKGLKTALNLHPAEGVGPQETGYEATARLMGVDPASRKAVPFDIADPTYIEAYFKHLHHPLEAQGIDFWWMDWQQGTTTKVENLDPLWLLNHLHFYDLGRNPSQRPFVFSRWGGLGNHRYPIGFSGDVHVTWDSLAFQPYFTANAANVGYGWWSHDIGGHISGMEDGELYARWVQFGVFSPILRLHSAKYTYVERHPWAFNDEVFRIARDAMQLRHALIPYLYTMSWRNHTESVPPITPMYYNHPEERDAYTHPSQYYYGSELVAAPFITPKDEAVGMSRKVVWLPEGGWFDFFSGEPYAGGANYAVYGNLDDIPVFAKAGAIVPMGVRQGWGGVQNPDALEVQIFPGASNRFDLYEDDGETQLYKQGASAITSFETRWSAGRLELAIHPARGDRSVVPAKRAFHLKFRAVAAPDRVTVLVDGQPREAAPVYDAPSGTLSLDLPGIAPEEKITVTLSVEAGELMSKRDRSLDRLRKLLRRMKLPASTKGMAEWLIKEGGLSNLEADLCELMKRKDFPHIDMWEYSRRVGKQVPILEEIGSSQLTAIIETFEQCSLVSKVSRPVTPG